MKGVIVSVLIVVSVVQFMAMPGQALDCGQVSSSIAPCIPFLIGTDASPSAGCCAGVKNMKALAPTVADKRAACECLKAAAAHYPNIKDDVASSLPKKCGIDFNIPISKTTNCQNIN